MMKRKQLLLTASVGLLVLVSTAAAQTTAFTYQGKLTDSGNLANAAYDMQFKLFDAATNGNQIGSTLTFDGSGTNPPAVSVTSGLFAVTLDFGTCSPPSPCFNGNARFLEIAVKPHGSGSYTTLTPRQPITATPYAMKTSNLTFNGAYNDGTTIFTASNTFAGEGAGLNTTPNSTLNNSFGKLNAFFGAGAGQANTTGFSNAFFGYETGFSNTTARDNAFFGSFAGKANTTGFENAFFGHNAGQANTSGQANAFFGVAAGDANTTGSSNAFFGGGAGQSNTASFNNTFIGTFADFNVSTPTGDNNTLLGFFTRVTSGISNATAIGSRAQVAQSNSLVLGGITGVNGGTDTNVGIGTTTPAERLHVNGNGLITGNFNISGTGTADILNATTQFNLGNARVLSAAGSGNLFAGINAGTNPNNTGFSNAFFGTQTGQANTTGNRNAFFGAGAGNANTTGNFNAFFGSLAGVSTTTSGGNAFFGAGAGENNTGFQNAFFGTFAGEFNTTGFNNTLIGYQAGVGANNLTNATAIGANAQVGQNNSLVLGAINGFNNATADTRVGIGTTTPVALLDVQRDGSAIPQSAWFTTYGAPNEILGRASDGTRAIPTATLNGTTLLSLGATGHNGNGFVTAPRASIVMDAAQAWTPSATGTQMRFRTTANDTTTIATRMIITNDGNVGIGTSGPDQLLTVNGGASKPGGGSWLAFSDARLKNVRGSFTAGLDAVLRLQPIRYEYRADNALGIKASGEQIGFVAQEVEKVIPEAVSRNARGYLLVNNDPILWAMLNAVKELKVENDSLKQKLQQVENQQQSEMEEMKRLVCLDHPKAAMCKAKK